MSLQHDQLVLDWYSFVQAIKKHYMTLTRCNSLGDLTLLRSNNMVDEYCERFSAHVVRIGRLDELLKVNIFTAGLLKPSNPT